MADFWKLNPKLWLFEQLWRNQFRLRKRLMLVYMIIEIFSSTSIMKKISKLYTLNTWLKLMANQCGWVDGPPVSLQKKDNPLTMVWVLLPRLPFHRHTWHYVKKIVILIGIPMAMNLATKGRIKSSMTDVRIEIDRTKSSVTDLDFN